VTGAPVIRAPREADAAALAALCGELGYPTAGEHALDRLLALVRDESRELLVAEVDGLVVAWLEWAVRPTLESGPRAEITGLVVAGPHRGRGVGGAMVRHASARALARGFATLRVRTNETRSRTSRFYESLGFTLAKTQRVYDLTLAPDPGTREA